MNPDNISLDKKTGEFLVNKVDYNLDDKYLKDCSVKFYKKENLPNGKLAFAYFEIDNFIYIFGGHSAGIDAIKGLSIGYEKYLVGNHKKKFYNNLLRYNINKESWENLGTIDEISPRSQMLFCTYNGKMYIFGGYSFKFMTLDYLNDYKQKYGKWPPKKSEGFHNEGFEISVVNNKILTKQICELPFEASFFKTFKLIKNKLYFIGGYTGKLQNQNIFINSIKDLLEGYNYNIQNKTINVGSILFYYDLEKNKLVIDSLFPGYPIGDANMTVYNEYLYIFTSHIYSNESLATFRPGEKNKICCNDNWKYNINTRKWIRIKNYPMKGVMCSTIIDYNDKYRLFCGGCRSFLETSISNNMKCQIINFPIKDEFNPKFKYGTISNTISKFNETKESHVNTLKNIGAYDYYQHYFSDFILIYDIIEDNYYTTNYKLPVNAANPNIIEHSNDIYFIGGEINDRLINGKFHGIQSNLCYVMDFKINE